EAGDVYSTRLGRYTVDHHAGRYVHIDVGLRADKAVCADAQELVDTNEAAEDGPVVDNHVTGHGGIVGEDHVVADDAVMGHVGVGHEQVVRTDARDPTPCFRATMHGGALTDNVSVTYLE